ncbi:ABC transporter ATP-binding protein [Planctomycetota bacterium]|nr:ABC transporter ATP-binding protein [Planctomycetota bacterium]
MAEQSRTLVTCAGVTKHFGEVTALSGIDLQVHEGELLMLVGPSGCGKTTLISILAGILDRDAGACSVLGTDPQALSDNERIAFRRENIGFIFQAFNLLPQLTAVQNVSIPLLLAGAGRRAAEAKAAQVLTAVGLVGRVGARPTELSGGQQQRVAIARALVHEPRLLVCDEPTSSLDHDTGQTVMGLLRDLARHPGRALVVVTHDARIFPFADRIVRMDDGRVVGESGPEQPQHSREPAASSHPAT